MITKQHKKWIHRNKEEYLDECDEYNYTKIAEDLANEFDLYCDENFTIPEEVFDVVVEELT